MTPATATRRFRIVLGLFIAGLIVSGVTAFPLLAEMKLLANSLGVGDAASPMGHDGLTFWILTVKCGLEDMYGQYPWIAYGTDWLAFGHIVIALFFVGPLIKPRESRFAIWTGIAACFLVIPLALICGPVRGIPLYWRLIDCSFGVFGAVPLFYCLSLLKRIDSTREVQGAIRSQTAVTPSE
ncbi:hypothetical protein [Verrucomicrobium sp. BvORR106]|uniref:hypothetical protein n=1 Tax=Verrucomicrobium sp. BvORR106 TaxID=1403819 RepID=UPI00056F04AE|nr:hypothetical protein [Verrucomicrobium sp. BvORR106]